MNRSRLWTRPWLWLVLVVLVGGCAGQAAESEALRRGDEAWARGDAEEALAEYRLALRASDDAETLLRVAHAYAELDAVSYLASVEKGEAPKLGRRVAIYGGVLSFCRVDKLR